MHGVDTALLCEVVAGEMEARYCNTQTLIIIQFVCIQTSGQGAKHLIRFNNCRALHRLKHVLLPR